MWLETKGERDRDVAKLLAEYKQRTLQSYLKHFRQQEALANRVVLMSTHSKPAKSWVAINISTINSDYHQPFDVSVCLKPQLILLLMAEALFILRWCTPRPLSAQTNWISIFAPKVSSTSKPLVKCQPFGDWPSTEEVTFQHKIGLCFSAPLPLLFF